MEAEEDMVDISTDHLYEHDCENDISRMSVLGYGDDDIECHYDDEDDQTYDQFNDPDEHEDDNLFSADDEDVHDSMDNPAQSVYARKQVAPFSSLTEKDIEQREDVAIEDVAAVLSISRTQARLLLQNFEWSVNKVHEEWFADELGVRARLGMLENQSIRPQKGQDIIQICGICLEDHPVVRMQAAACHDHFFCVLCWGGYAHSSISDGPGCLSLRCPHPGCKASVDEDFIMSVVSEEDKQKYRRYIHRSYVESNRRVKWCPAPGCEYAVELNPDQSSDVPDVTCACGYGFCWSCCEETHRPVECATIVKWMIKINSDESMNISWLLVNSKPCPECKRPIEKSMGCMHMTCTAPCRYEFCWLCRGDWKKHEGSFYACNQYEEDKRAGKHDQVERKLAEAKSELDRYTHYYERWALNGRSRATALSDLQKFQVEKMEKLMDLYTLPRSQLKFITEAWLQIVECRQVLRWTYAYGYYLPTHEVAKKQFFEYLQGEAEAALERLHRCAEEDVGDIINKGSATCTFVEFCAKLTGLTTVTRNYFQNLVEALENGLADVESCKASGKRRHKKKKKNKKRKASDDANQSSAEASCGKRRSKKEKKNKKRSKASQ